MISPEIVVETSGGIGWIILDRPPLNVITTGMCRSLVAALAAFDADPAVRVIALTSALPRAFAAGSDVGEHVAEAVDEHSAAIFDAAAALSSADGKPRIAAVRGYCSGGGNELAFACDFVVAADDTRFALPEIELGVVSALAACLMTRHLPVSRVKEIAFGGGWIDAREAERVGLVTRLLPAGDFDRAVREYLAAFAAKSGPALRVGRKLLMQALGHADLGYLDRLRTAILGEALALPDYAEGVAAFLEKRRPVWRDAPPD